MAPPANYITRRCGSSGEGAVGEQQLLLCDAKALAFNQTLTEFSAPLAR